MERRTLGEMWRRRIAVVLAVVTSSATATADDNVVALDYRGACEAGKLRDRTRELVGREPFDDRGVATIRVEVSDGTGVRVDLTMFDRRGVSGPSRRIEGTTCEEALDSAALVIAMILAQPRAQEPARLQRSDGEPPPARLDRTEISDRVEIPARATHAGLILGGAMSSRGQLGWSLGFQLRGRNKTLEIAFEHRADQELEPGAARGQVGHVGGSIAPCLVWGSFATCGIAVGGAITGQTADRARSATSPFAAVGTRIAWEQQIGGSLALRAQVDAQLAVTKTRVWLDHMVVWESPRAEVWSGIVVVARFP